MNKFNVKNLITERIKECIYDIVNDELENNSRELIDEMLDDKMSGYDEDIRFRVGERFAEEFDAHVHDMMDSFLIDWIDESIDLVLDGMS